MAVGVEIPRATFVGNGSATVFPTGFTYTDPSDVQVYLDDVLENSGFTVNESGVVFVVPPADGVSVVLLRTTPLDQPIPFEDPQKTTLAEVERVADKLTRQQQEREEKLNRSIVLPPSSTPDSRALTSLGYDPQGNPVPRTADEEVNFLGIGPKVAEAMQAATAAQEALSQFPGAKLRASSNILKFRFNS